MLKYRFELIKEIPNDEGKKVNYLIKEGKVDLNDIINDLIATQDPNLIYYFARLVEGAPIEKLEDAIIETRDAEYIYLFARFVRGASVKKLYAAYLETKDEKYIKDFELLYRRFESLRERGRELHELDDKIAKMILSKKYLYR